MFSQTRGLGTGAVEQTVTRPESSRLQRRVEAQPTGPGDQEGVLSTRQQEGASAWVMHALELPHFQCPVAYTSGDFSDPK